MAWKCSLKAWTFFCSKLSILPHDYRLPVSGRAPRWWGWKRRKSRMKGNKFRPLGWGTPVEEKRDPPRSKLPMNISFFLFFSISISIFRGRLFKRMRSRLFFFSSSSLFYLLLIYRSFVGGMFTAGRKLDRILNRLKWFCVHLSPYRTYRKVVCCRPRRVKGLPSQQVVEVRGTKKKKK